MTPEKKHGPKGGMYLRRDWEESASSHVESFDDVSLEASSGDVVIMTHAHGTKNFIRIGASNYVEDRYQIGGADLIKLIKKHGKRVTED